MIERSVPDVTRNKILLAVQSLLCVLLCALPAVSAVGLYRTGAAEQQENPLAWVYTRDRAAAALKPVLPVFLLSVGVTVACAVLHVRDENENTPVTDAELSRDRLLERVAQPNEAMKKEQAVQKKLLYGGWGGFALCMLPVLLYMADKDHFPNGDMERVTGALVLHVVPWIVAGFAALIVSATLRDKSIRREYNAILARIEEEKAAGLRAEPPKAAPERNVNTLRVLLLAIALTFILLGIRNGGMTAVANKAIRICTECVGLG